MKTSDPLNTPLKNLYAEVKPSDRAIDRTRQRLRAELSARDQSAGPDALAEATIHVFRRYVLAASVALVALSFAIDRNLEFRDSVGGGPAPGAEAFMTEMDEWLFGGGHGEALTPEIPEFLLLSELHTNGIN